MWDYICPRCRREVAKNSRKCVHCGEQFGVPIRVPPKVLKDQKALEKYVHKHVFPKVSASQREYLTQFFTTLFSNGFEEGNFTAWSYTMGAPSIVNTPVHHGSYAFKSDAVGECCVKSFAGQTLCYARWYVQFADLENLGNGLHVYIGGFWGNEGWSECMVRVSRTAAGVLQIGCYVRRGFSTDVNWAGVNDTWYCIEIRYKKDAVDGGYSLWVDGVQLINVTGKDYSAAGDIQWVMCGDEGNSGDIVVFYEDCVVVADTYIGVEGGAILKEVADSLSLSDSVLRDKILTISDSIASLDSLLAHKTLQITDTITVLETILRNKTFTVSDSIGLSELITVITGGILKEVLDTIGLSEQVKINKSFIIQDTVSLLDQIFRHKPSITITDAVALAEIIAVSKLFTITDAVSIADVVYAMKTLPIYDQITITDQVSTPTRILQALDTIGLSDTLYVNKTLIITDQIGLAEVVEVGKGGAQKTKLFLILGDLAIQIQG